MKSLAKYLAEFIGTFTLALVVVLSVAGEFPVSTPVLAAVTLLIFVYTIGTISGSHINPAVTIGLLARNKINWQEALGYIFVQLLAGTFAMYLAGYLGAEVDANAIRGTNVILAEMLGAAVFGFGIMSVVREKADDDVSGVVIGGSLFLGIALAALIGSAGVLNPAVALALGLTNWQYLLASVVGVVVGMVGYDLLIGESFKTVKITFTEKKKKE